jgi:hypothetical protein
LFAYLKNSSRLGTGSPARSHSVNRVIVPTTATEVHDVRIMRNKIGTVAPLQHKEGNGYTHTRWQPLSCSSNTFTSPTKQNGTLPGPKKINPTHVLQQPASSNPRERGKADHSHLLERATSRSYPAQSPAANPPNNTTQFARALFFLCTSREPWSTRREAGGCDESPQCKYDLASFHTPLREMGGAAHPPSRHTRTRAASGSRTSGALVTPPKPACARSCAGDGAHGAARGRAGL